MRKINGTSRGRVDAVKLRGRCHKCLLHQTAILYSGDCEDIDDRGKAVQNYPDEMCMTVPPWKMTYSRLKVRSLFLWKADMEDVNAHMPTPSEFLANV